jgi:hypothetical protein
MNAISVNCRIIVSCPQEVVKIRYNDVQLVVPILGATKLIICESRVIIVLLVQTLALLACTIPVAMTSHLV